MNGTGAEPIDASGLDLDQYDLPGLRSDIDQILDLPTAIGELLKRSLTFVGVGAIVVWFVFGERMSAWLSAPYMLFAFPCLLLAAAAISAFRLLRTRLDDTTRAADRTLFTVAAMHGDLVELRESGEAVPKRMVASFITQSVVFPFLMGSAGTALDSAATVTGPVGWLSRLILRRALSEVENRVLAALDGVDEASRSPVDAIEPMDGDDPWASLPDLEIPDEFVVGTRTFTAI